MGSHAQTATPPKNQRVPKLYLFLGFGQYQSQMFSSNFVWPMHSRLKLRGFPFGHLAGVSPCRFGVGMACEPLERAWGGKGGPKGPKTEALSSQDCSLLIHYGRPEFAPRLENNDQTTHGVEHWYWVREFSPCKRSQVDLFGPCHCYHGYSLSYLIDKKVGVTFWRGQKNAVFYLDPILSSGVGHKTRRCMAVERLRGRGCSKTKGPLHHVMTTLFKPLRWLLQIAMPFVGGTPFCKAPPTSLLYLPHNYLLPAWIRMGVHVPWEFQRPSCKDPVAGNHDTDSEC